MDNSKTISHWCRTKDLHSWCANRNFEETHCDCQCHKRKSKMKDKLEELLDNFESAILKVEEERIENEFVIVTDKTDQSRKIKVELNLKNTREAIINYVTKE